MGLEFLDPGHSAAIILERKTKCVTHPSQQAKAEDLDLIGQVNAAALRPERERLVEPSNEGKGTLPEPRGQVYRSADHGRAGQARNLTPETRTLHQRCESGGEASGPGRAGDQG